MTMKVTLLFTESIENLGIYDIDTSSQSTYKLGKVDLTLSAEAFLRSWL